MNLGYDQQALHPRVRPPRLLPEEVLRDRGRARPEQTAIIADAKHLIFEGMLQAVARRRAVGDRRARRRAVRLDVPAEARERGLKLAMPVERSGQNEFDFQYGDDFGEHIERFDPDFTKVLVRYNPDGDAEANREQLEKLKRALDWLHAHDRKFLFELLVPAEDPSWQAVGGDSTAMTQSCAPS
jgi:myo-inositol catabolism protein IolC